MSHELPSLNRRRFLSAAVSIGSIAALTTLFVPPEYAHAAVDTLPETGWVPPQSLATSYGSNVYMKRMPDGSGVIKTYKDAFTTTSVARADFFKGTDNKMKIALSVIGKHNQFQVLDVASGVNTTTTTPFTDSAGGLASIQYNSRDGKVYAIGDGEMYSWSQGAPAMAGLGKLTEKTTAGYGFAFDSKGRVWAGGYPQSIFACYDPATGTIKSYPPVDPESAYIRSITIINDVVYLGTGSASPKIFYFSVDTPEDVKQLPNPSNIGPTGFIDKLDTHYGRLFAFYEDVNLKSRISVYNPAWGTWRTFPYAATGRQVTSSNGGEKIYFVATPSGQPLSIIEWNVRTNTQGFTMPAPMAPKTLHLDTSTGVPLLYMFGEDEAKENHIFCTVNLTTKAVVFDGGADIKSAPLKVQDFIVSPDGKMYVGGYMGDGIGSITIKDDVRWRSGRADGIHQIEGMMEYDRNTIYIGSYGSAVLLKYTKAPHEIITLAKLRTDYGQSRPFGWAVAAGKIVTGTVPDYGLQGGALGIIDPVTNGVEVVDNLINRQSILSLVGEGDIVYGTTGIKGGLGAALDENPAKVFAYDVRTRKLLWTTGSTLKHESDIYSPVIVGDRLFVAVANGIIELDKSGKAVKTYLLSERPNIPAWRNVRMAFDPRSNSLIHRSSGVITSINLKDNSRTILYTDDAAGIIKITDDGRLFAVTDDSMNISEISTAFSPTIESAGDVVSISPGGGINLKKSDGSGGYASSGIGIISSGYSDAKSVHVVDWNNDGVYDLVSNHTDGSLRVRHGIRTGGFGESIVVSKAGMGWDTKRITTGMWDSSTVFNDLLSIDSSGRLEQWRVWSTGSVGLVKEIGTGWGKYDIAMFDYKYDGVMGLIFREGAKMFWVPRDATGRVSPTSASRVEIAAGGWSSCVEFAAVKNHWRSYNGVVWKDSAGTLRYTSNLSSASLGGNKEYGTSLASYRLGGTSK
jgi:hypothetical protein